MRTTILSSVVAGAILVACGASSANAQTYLPNPGLNPPSGSVPGGSWSGYAPVSPWEGYQPGVPWSGYNPPRGTAVAPPPATVLAPQPRAVAPSAVPRIATGGTRYYVTAPTVTTRPASRNQPYFPGSRLMVPPSHYREYGTGRNIYLHKPWLPNQ